MWRFTEMVIRVWRTKISLNALSVHRACLVWCQLLTRNKEHLTMNLSSSQITNKQIYLMNVESIESHKNQPCVMLNWTNEEKKIKPSGTNIELTRTFLFHVHSTVQTRSVHQSYLDHDCNSRVKEKPAQKCQKKELHSQLIDVCSKHLLTISVTSVRWYLIQHDVCFAHYSSK